MEAVSDAQVPPAALLNVDHVAHFVPDIDAASAALERLGFTLTPFSPQSHRLEPEGPLVPAGTGNRCVMLERGYLEFLTPTLDTPVADPLRAAIARYIGVHLIAFGTSAPERDHTRLATEGFEPLPPVALQRPIGTESGEDTARFTVVRVPPGRMAEGRIQFCRHHTPQLLWQRRWLEHRNGVLGIAGVFLCAADPEEAAARYSRFTGLEAKRAESTWRIETARGVLVFVQAQTLERSFHVTAPALPWIAGYVLECKAPGATRDYLSRAGAEVTTMARGHLLVPLPPALGGIIVFAAPGASAPDFQAGTLQSAS